MKKVDMFRKKLIPSLVALVFWLCVWQLAALLLAKPWLLPAPLTVAVRAAELLPSADFWRTIAHTLLRIMLGFTLGVITGVALAVLTRVSRLADALISPALKAILATPVPSFSILLLVWLKQTGSVPVVISFLVVLPVAWRNICAGIQATDAQLLEMAATFRLSRWRVLRYIYLPSLLPHFLSACTVALGLAWKSGVAAEVISMPRQAIGTALQQGRAYLLISDVFVWTIAVIVLSLLLEWLLTVLLRRLGEGKAWR